MIIIEKQKRESTSELSFFEEINLLCILFLDIHVDDVSVVFVAY